MRPDDRALIHLVFASDGNMLPAACVAMKSAVLGNGGRDDFILHVLNPGFGDAELHAVRDVMAGCANARLDFMTVTPGDFPEALPKGPFMTYARLLIGRLIDAPRAIYLDCDTLVVGNLRELWNMPFDGHALLAVAGHTWDPPGTYGELVRFGKRKDTTGPYFNSGVLVIDLDAFRAAQDELLGALFRYSRWNLDWDQGVLNYVFRGRIKELPRHWNTCSQTEGARRAGVIHYQAPDRPWQYRKRAVVYRMWWKFFLGRVVPCTDLDSVAQLTKRRRRLPSLPRKTGQASRWSRFGDAVVHGLGLFRICVRRMTHARKRIMLYKSKLDFLGDMILLTGVVPHYRKLFPDAILEIVCNDDGVDLMRAMGVFDAVWPMSQLSREGRPSWLNAGRSDLFISLRRTVSPADLMWMRNFRPTRTIGFTGDLLTHRVAKLSAYKELLSCECELPDDGGGSALHELDVQRKMLSTLGKDLPVEALRPRIPDAYADRSVAEAVERLYNLGDTPFYLCCPCGSQPIRSYAPEKWHRVFAELAPCVVAVCATGKDWREVLGLTAMPIDGVAWVNLAGQTTLPQLAGLMLRADAVLSVESGPLHMAVGLGRPLVGVCGLGHVGRFVPYPFEIHNAEFLFGDCEYRGCGWKCFSDAAVCIKGLDPGAIVAAVRRVTKS